MLGIRLTSALAEFGKKDQAHPRLAGVGAKLGNKVRVKSCFLS